MEALIHTATLLVLAGIAWGDLRARVAGIEKRLDDHIRTVKNGQPN
jgi:hypothetical protein